MLHQAGLQVETRTRGFHRLDTEVQGIVVESGVQHGLVNVFVHHTSCSLFINENADPDVRVDLESWFSRLVQDGDPLFRHTAEGDDDMSAHIRSVLTATSMSIPVQNGRLGLGTWQGLYLWEHRTHPHSRRVTVTVMGADPGA